MFIPEVMIICGFAYAIACQKTSYSVKNKKVSIILAVLILLGALTVQHCSNIGYF